MNAIGNFVKRGLLVLMTVFVGLTVQAQDWGDMVGWMRGGGMKRLAEIAHPADAQDGPRFSLVEASSSSIVVRITYEGFNGSYTDTYTIIKGNYRGSDYFRRIRVEEDFDPFFGAFNAIDNFGAGYADLYSRLDIAPLYGNNSSFWDLSKGEKAAFILFCFFLQYYNY